MLIQPAAKVGRYAEAAKPREDVFVGSAVD